VTFETCNQEEEEEWDPQMKAIIQKDLLQRQQQSIPIRPKQPLVLLTAQQLLRHLGMLTFIRIHPEPFLHIHHHHHHLPLILRVRNRGIDQDRIPRHNTKKHEQEWPWPMELLLLME
jgi:hypothetical protein